MTATIIEGPDWGSMTPMECLRTQLQQAVNLRLSGVWPKPPKDWRFRCMEDLVLQHGREYKPAPITWATTPRMCFHNSYNRATRRNSRWMYVEGYALRPPLQMAIHHCWLTQADAPESAFDQAWGYDPTATYLGVPVAAPYVSSCHKLSGGKQYSVFDTYWMDFALLSGKHRIEDVML